MRALRTGDIPAVAAIATAVVAVLLASLWYTCGFRGCPDVEKLRAYIPDQASVVLDRRGAEVAKLYRVDRRIVPLDSLPKYVPAAFVAVEDRRFYSHHGVDWARVPGAVMVDLRRHGFAQGFSTITMQLARNLFPDRLPAAERSPLRKLAEMRVATAIEGKFSKQDILQMYLNQIYFGHGAWGIEAAAQEYFGKPARQLTVAEAATLAGLPQSPTRANPRADPVAATARRNLVLDAMASQGVITPAEAGAAKGARMRVRLGRDPTGVQQAPYFLEEVRQQLEAQLGEAIYTDGLRIHTTLDLPTQRVAESELERQLESIERGGYGAFRHARYDPQRPVTADTSDDTPAYLQGALLMLDSQTGDVLAWIGGRDFAQSRFDRVAQARRQPGSAFKPFVYTAAIQAGYPPSYQLLDAPLVVPVSRGVTWSPQNYEGDYRGTMPMVEALAESRNVPTVRLAGQVGLDRVIQTARQMGIDEKLPYVPSLALGVADVTPMELTAAYTAFSSLGNRVQPRVVTSVEDRDGKVVWSQGPQSQQTIDPAVAFVMTSMLQQVIDHGTGTPVRAAGFRGPAGGKTGTTQSGNDAWFVGFTPRITLGIWMGFDHPAPIASSATGGLLAAPVWGRIMARTAAPSGGWNPPAGVERLWLGSGGTVLAAACPAPAGGQQLWFVSGTAPRTTGCTAAGGYAQANPTDTVAVDSARVSPPLSPPDQGWWNSVRSRIFGGGDSTAARAARAGGAARGQPPVAERGQPAEPLPAEPAGRGDTVGRPAAPSRVLGRAIPRDSTGSAPSRPRPVVPPAGQPAQPAPPPPDTSGG